MNQDTVVNLAPQAMSLAMKVAGPLLLVGLAIGLLVSVFQAVTQIQEQSLSLIPKIVGVAAVIVMLGPWMLGQLLGYTRTLYTLDPVAGGLVNRPAARSPSSRATQLAGFILVLARVTPLFFIAPLFSSTHDPARACAGSSPWRISIGLDAGRDARPARPERRARAGRPRARGAARRARASRFSLAVLFAAVESAGRAPRRARRASPSAPRSTRSAATSGA